MNFPREPQICRRRNKRKQRFTIYVRGIKISPLLFQLLLLCFFFLIFFFCLQHHIELDPGMKKSREKRLQKKKKDFFSKGLFVYLSIEFPRKIL